MRKSQKNKPSRFFLSPKTLLSSNLESLESRRMLSATTAVASTDVTISPLSAASSFQGYTVAQIRHAYGFDQVSDTGTGETIAIVDAFNDPNIAADLHTFDVKMGIADPPSLTVESQTGGSVSTLKTDAGWASEISLDVEWAHAIAPNAKIVLVEANTDSLSNLMAAVNTARNISSVSVVSMSWGGSEFSGVSQYNSILTTPAGHQGVTFVASSGDDGSAYGVSWPASSPNVLSVGGTTLYTTGANGTYATETGWSDSGGGVSQLYSEPAYQTAAQSTGGRTNPDVSYNANPNTGFAVYDSIADDGYVGWQVIGGTSAGAPQWSALVALADQSRAAAGKASLDGATGTLPDLYKLYSAPGTASYASYVSDFNDITSGASSYALRAHAGYDGVTGLGTPKAAAVIAALSSSASTTTTTSTTTTASTPTATRALARAQTTVTQSTAPAPLLVPAIRPTTFATASVAAIHDLMEGTSVSAADLAQVTAVSAASVDTVRSNYGGYDAPQAIAPTAVSAISLGSAVVPTVFSSTVTALPSGVQWGTAAMMSSFADAMASFAHESAAASTLSSLSTSMADHGVAWATTGVMATLDTVLIASWIANRREAKKEKQREAAYRSAFSLQEIKV